MQLDYYEYPIGIKLSYMKKCAYRHPNTPC